MISFEAGIMMGGMKWMAPVILYFPQGYLMLVTRFLPTVTRL